MSKLSTQILLLLVLVLPGWLLAQTPMLDSFWAVQFDTGVQAKELLDKLPAGAIFINDAGAGELGEGQYSGLVLSAKAQEQVKNYDFAEEFTREFTCTQPSVAFYMQAPFPMEIYQDSKLLVMRMEYYDMVRVIFLDGRQHPPADAPHTKNGHSIGHWEGDELVVDTTHIAAATFMNNGFSHSDNLHLSERFKLSADGQVLLATQISEDPEVFQGMAARLMAWRRVANQYIYPYECDASFGE